MNRVPLAFLLLIIFLLLYFHPAQAQRKWKKALPEKNGVSYNNGKFNIGIKAGAIWSYFGYSILKNTTYDGIISPIAGLLLEYKTNTPLSVGFNPYVAIRGTSMHHDKVWQSGLGTQTDTTRTQYTCQMNIVGTRFPFTYYFNSFIFSNPKDKQFYVTLAPEAYYVLGGKIRYSKIDMPQGTFKSDTSILIGKANMQRLQFGVTCGAGFSSKHNINAFAFVMKYELAFSFGINNIFSKMESQQGGFPENGGFAGSPYATIQQGQRRYRALDFSITLMFPIKKQLRGACINWGEFN